MTRSLVLLSLALLIAPAALADADLQTVVNFPPAGQVIPAIAGSGSRLELTLFNNGPDVARNVVLRVELPPNVTVYRSGDERCDFTAVPIVCRAGDVPTDYTQGAPHFTFDLNFPLSEGTHTVTATATSADTPDPKPDNNRITATYTTTIVVDLHVMSEPPVIRADPGQAVPVRVSLSNFVPFIQPKDARMRFEAENGAIEKVDAPEGWTCSGLGAATECVAALGLEPGCACGFFTVTVRPSSDRSGGVAHLRTTATSTITDYYLGNNQAATDIQIRRVLAVTSTADAGAGSLRAAIEEANRAGATPTKIAFELPGPVPAEGWFTIAPSSPLPAITADRVAIDGATQTALTGDTNPLGPEIALDGRFTSSGHGLDVYSHCEATIEHLAIGNFRDHAVATGVGEICRDGTVIDRRLIANNYLGVDPTGKAAWPNLRGVLLRGFEARYTVTKNVISGNVRSGVWANTAATITENLIGTAAEGKTPLPNGASGIYLSPRVGVAEVLGNTIAFHPQMGVAIDRGADQIEVRQNSMHDNGGLGIDWELDGVTPQRDDTGKEPTNAPILLSARYEAATNRTLLTLSVKTGPMNGTIFPSAAAIVDVYANAGPDGDGERHVSGGNYAANTEGQPFTYELQGDYRGQWINATATRIYFLFAKPPSGQVANSLAGGFTRTSELSNAAQVQ